MSAESPLQKPVVRAGLLVEAAPYFLLGAFLACAGLVAVFLWSVEQWTLGYRHEALITGALGIVWVGGFIATTRAKSRVLTLAIVLVGLGFLAYLLRAFGVHVPLFGG